MPRIFPLLVNSIFIKAISGTPCFLAEKLWKSVFQALCTSYIIYCDLSHF